MVGGVKCAAILCVIGVLLGAAGRGDAQSPALPAGDPGAGLQAFLTWCAQCHSFDKEGPSILAPNLFGIFGKETGLDRNFRNYSDELIGAGIIWDEAALNEWLQGSQKMVPGTRMEFPGIELPDRLNIIAFLKQNR